MSTAAKVGGSLTKLRVMLESAMEAVTALEHQGVTLQADEISRNIGWIGEAQYGVADVCEEEADKFVSVVNQLISEIHDGGYGKLRDQFELYSENRVRNMAFGILTMLMHKSQRDYLNTVGETVLCQLEK